MEVEQEIPTGIFDTLAEGGDIRQVLTHGIVGGLIVRRLLLGVHEEPHAESVPTAIGDEPFNQVIDFRAVDIFVSGTILLVFGQHRDVSAYVTRLRACACPRER